MFKKRFEKWKSKGLGAKISDIVFVALIVAIIIPATRIEVIGFVNRVKAKIIQPGLKKESKYVQLKPGDFNWEIISLQEGRTNLSNYQGKVVFLNLWATWCPPCVGELPEIQKMVDKFAGNDKIEFVLVSNEEPQVVQNFLEKRGYHLPVYLTFEKTPQAFYTRSIPTSFLISKSGEIVLVEKGAVNWGGKKMENIINQLLAE